MQFFQICFGVGVLFTIVSFLLGHLSDFGGGSLETHVDTNLDTNIDTDMNHDLGHFDNNTSTNILNSFLVALKPLTVSSFLTMFGGMGIILMMNNVNIILSYIISCVAGFALSTFLFKTILAPLLKYQSTSSPMEEELLGTEAHVTIKVSPTDFGQIYYTFKGNSFNSPAKSYDKNTFEVNEYVRIQKIEKGVYYVVSALRFDTNKSDS